MEDEILFLSSSLPLFLSSSAYSATLWYVPLKKYMPKINHKILFLTSSLTFLLTLPVMANLGDVWTNFQYYGTDLQNYLKTNIPDTLKPLEVQSQTAITNSTGSLKIPNPNAAGNAVSQQVTQYSISDKFENNPAVHGVMVRNNIDRQITRSSVEGTIASNGQRRLSIVLQNTEIAANNITRYANSAATNKQAIDGQIKGVVILPPTGNPIADASNVLLNSQAQIQLTRLTWEGLSELNLQNINIQNEQSKIIGETLGNTIQIHESLQYSNLNLANISEQMDEVNRARRVDTSAEVARLLRVTSQTDLLGRKN